METAICEIEQESTQAVDEDALVRQLRSIITASIPAFFKSVFKDGFKSIFGSFFNGIMGLFIGVVLGLALGFVYNFFDSQAVPEQAEMIHAHATALLDTIIEKRLLVARGVYSQIAPARRGVMHRRVAELIEEEAALDLEHASDLAHHALASGDPSLGSRAMVSAGKLCLRFFANDDALVLARKGLQLAAQLSDAEHVCRRLELFEVMLSAAPVYDWEAAAEEYAALAERALDHGALAHARLG